MKITVKQLKCLVREAMRLGPDLADAVRIHLDEMQRYQIPVKSVPAESLAAYMVDTAHDRSYFVRANPAQLVPHIEAWQASAVDRA